MANDNIKKPDMNKKNIPSSKPDPNINRSSPGSSGSGSKGSGDFGSSPRNSNPDMNKDRNSSGDVNKNTNKDMNKDTNKPGSGGFKTSSRDADLDRSQGTMKRTDNEVSGGSSSGSGGSSRNH